MSEGALPFDSCVRAVLLLLHQGLVFFSFFVDKDPRAIAPGIEFALSFVHSSAWAV